MVKHCMGSPTQDLQMGLMGDGGLPGVFFTYELSPMMVKYTEKQRSAVYLHHCHHHHYHLPHYVLNIINISTSLCLVNLLLLHPSPVCPLSLYQHSFSLAILLLTYSSSLLRINHYSLTFSALSQTDVHMLSSSSSVQSS